MTVRDLRILLGEATAELAQARVPSARVDAELLAGHVLGLSRGAVQAKSVAGAEISEDAVDRLRDLVQERARRVPLQHLTGRAPFRNLELRVGPGVFIPRPETEQVVEAVLEHLAALGIPHPRVIDLGTGSGAIAAAIATEHPDSEVHAVELSEEAASWAELNLEPHGVTLHRQDLREIPEHWQAGFDVVVSNPPYIPPGMVPTEEEVRDHDPALALYGGGADGLELPRAVIAAATQLLVPGGWFILEHAEVQAAEIGAICTEDPRLSRVRSHQDLSGRARATSAVYAGPRSTGMGEYSA